MGVDEWQNKHSRQGKPQLRDFLDDEEEENVILRMARACAESQHNAVDQTASKCSGLFPLPAAATYPEGYNTIDRRRRKKKTRDPGGLYAVDPETLGEDTPDPDALRHKRGELVMKKVAEIQEEEEQMTPCLRPYKNGLLYKTRMWAKNELENTLENYVVYKEQEAARLRAGLGYDFEGSDQHYLMETDMAAIDFLADDLQSTNNGGHSMNRYSLSYPADTPHSHRDKRAGKLGGWTPEALLSPVEEPCDEFVDPMDELQCLVETVSEYLAEKEEEISKYGSLPRTSKSRLSSVGSNTTDSLGDEPNGASKDPKAETNTQENSEQADSNQQIPNNCYQPGQRRRSSAAVTVKHIKDTSEEEWRKRVTPGEEQPNRRRISSLISSFVGKTSEADSGIVPQEQQRTVTSKATDQQAKNFLSSGLQSLRSKVLGQADRKPCHQQDRPKKNQHPNQLVDFLVFPLAICYQEHLRLLKLLHHLQQFQLMMLNKKNRSWSKFSPDCAVGYNTHC
ncbi:hypothetical protein NHX12_027773 [Muraenolepis orangiensis]|uniref:Uncharacterized protein n=1 Tax=Muraenolepis orangiensis TaxID=630683 RepID=A0A9Q0EFC5_9TELE|nr:hypothetical protein NHX12_027773 [Muraenolepis orangiensis]